MEETKLQNIFIDEKRRPCVVYCGERSLCACARKWTSTKRPLAAETNDIQFSFFIGASNRQARILYAVNQKCSRKFTDRVYEISKQNRTCSQKQHQSVTSDSADDDLSLARFFPFCYSMMKN